mmetsp:Transcript_21305/g.62000  ORF Transcript_21305/g.62000 Transcript_21305/m.62000 type:complete len:251 (-) Transcript_21305:1118-1870(-)
MWAKMVEDLWSLNIFPESRWIMQGASSSSSRGSRSDERGSSGLDWADFAAGVTDAGGTFPALPVGADTLGNVASMLAFALSAAVPLFWSTLGVIKADPELGPLGCFLDEAPTEHLSPTSCTGLFFKAAAFVAKAGFFGGGPAVFRLSEFGTDFPPPAGGRPIAGCAEPISRADWSSPALRFFFIPPLLSPPSGPACFLVATESSSNGLDQAPAPPPPPPSGRSCAEGRGAAACPAVGGSALRSTTSGAAR